MGKGKVTGPKKRPGPEPGRLKIRGDWAKAVAKALKKKAPEKPKSGQ